MNRYQVTISDLDFTLVSEEDEAYVHKVARYVDTKMRGVLENDGVSTLDAAVLAAVNIADEYFKSVDSGENIRVQLKEYLDESGKLKNEISELKRELVRLQNGKK
ncbi:cell division protein ZapA [Oscillospiraceae bacterium OttesenSCG-928-F05]|nr:cell division protein ZapA [Oscillospiraceae bacterium OttesenSCG-928-F05]